VTIVRTFSEGKQRGIKCNLAASNYIHIGLISLIKALVSQETVVVPISQQDTQSDFCIPTCESNRGQGGADCESTKMGEELAKFVDHLWVG
jgi:hypothetical protein